MIWLQFFAAAILIIIAGTKLTKSADILGSALGLGAGWAGVLLLPLATSLPEAVTSFRAVIIHSPDLAAGNLLGSNLFNISIIALIDLIQGKGSIFLRIKNGHVLTASLSIMLMSITAIGILLPLPSLWNGWIGLDTVLLIGGYLVAVRLLTVHEKRNMSPEEISCPASTSTIKALLTFVAAALVILFAGVTLTDAANVISFTTGLGQTFVGSMMLAVSTSLPEVVTTATAARLGMFDMAIGNIFGANIYNIFLLAAADLIYLPGPLLQSVSSGHLLTIMMAIILTSIASTGLVYCSKRCVGRLGINSVFILLGYFTAAAVLFFTRTG